MVVAYSISEHTVLWCDPAIADDLAALADPRRPSRMTRSARGRSESVGRSISFARMQLLRDSGVVRRRLPIRRDAGTRSRTSDDVALVDAFRGTLSDDDRDEADLDEDRLDDTCWRSSTSVESLPCVAATIHLRGRIRRHRHRHAARCAWPRPWPSRRRCAVRRDRGARIVPAVPMRRSERRLGQAECVAWASCRSSGSSPSSDPRPQRVSHRAASDRSWRHQ